jgi:acetate kinase
MLLPVLNAGSSSPKFTLFDSAGERTLAEGHADRSGDTASYTFRPANGPAVEVAGIGWSTADRSSRRRRG